MRAPLGSLNFKNVTNMGNNINSCKTTIFKSHSSRPSYSLPKEVTKDKLNEPEGTLVTWGKKFTKGIKKIQDKIENINRMKENKSS